MSMRRQSVRRKPIATGVRAAKERAALRAAFRRAPVTNVRIGGFEGIENKFLDTELTSTAMTTAWTNLNPTGTGSTDTLSVPSEGNGESQRIGRVYTINSIHFNGEIIQANAESQTGVPSVLKARVCIVWDTQTNAAEMVGTDVMDDGGSDDVLAFRNLQNSKRFIVLMDKRFTIQPQVVNEGAINLFAKQNTVRTFQFNRRFPKGIKVRSTGTTANVTSCADNNIGVIQIADSTALLLGYQCRIRFTG